jgi:type IV secretion system protein VirB10
VSLFGRLRGSSSPEPQHPSGGEGPVDGEPAHDTVPGERGISSVNRAPSLQARISNLLAVALMAGLSVAFLTWYYGHAVSGRTNGQSAARTVSKTKAQGEMVLPPLGRVDPPPTARINASVIDRALGAAPPEPIRLEEVLPTNGYGGAPPNGGVAPGGVQQPPTKTPAQLTLERQLSGPVFSGPSSSLAAIAATSPSDEDLDHRGPPGTTDRRDSASNLNPLLRSSLTSTVEAKVLPTQRLLLPKGSFLDCTLETAIDSTLPGMTTCILATDSFSADGSVVLLERGTKLVGETRGQVRQGAARLFVLWTEARTPTGVIVPLASPGTDELGRSGLPGEVDRHFWDRFGAAILVTVIDGAVQAAVQSRNSSGTVIVDPSASRDVMTEVLKSTIDIPPTITKANGDRIQVLVARDLDFRSVYELRPAAASR